MQKSRVAVFAMALMSSLWNAAAHHNEAWSDKDLYEIIFRGSLIATAIFNLSDTA